MTLISIPGAGAGASIWCTYTKPSSTDTSTTGEAQSRHAATPPSRSRSRSPPSVSLCTFIWMTPGCLTADRTLKRRCRLEQASSSSIALTISICCSVTRRYYVGAGRNRNEVSSTGSKRASECWCRGATRPSSRTEDSVHLAAHVLIGDGFALIERREALANLLPKPSPRVPSICQLFIDQIAQVIDNKYGTVSPLESKIKSKIPPKFLIPRDRI